MTEQVATVPELVETILKNHGLAEPTPSLVRDLAQIFDAIHATFAAGYTHKGDQKHRQWVEERTAMHRCIHMQRVSLRRLGDAHKANLDELRQWRLGCRPPPADRNPER